MRSFVGLLDPTRPLVDWAAIIAYRYGRVQQLMAEQGLDALLVTTPDNVLYATGWPRFRPSAHEGAYNALVVRDAAEPVIFCSEGDEGGARQDALAADIRVLPPWNRQWPPLFRQALGDYGVLGKTVGLDGRMGVRLWQQVTAALEGTTVVDAGRVFDRARMVKSPDEVQAYEQVVSIVEIGVNTAIAMAGNRWARHTELEIATAANVELLRRGCHSPDIWCVSGYRTAPVRRYSTDKVVRGEEVLLVDGGGTLNGYRSEFARTVWTGGRPTAEQRRVYQTVHRALQAAEALIRPGAMTAKLEEAVLAVVEEAGLAAYYGGYPYLGHGIGIGPEPPMVTARYPGHDTALEAGMLINLEPGVWVPGVGGVRLENTYLVTDGGCRTLTRAPYDEALLGG